MAAASEDRPPPGAGAATHNAKLLPHSSFARVLYSPSAGTARLGHRLTRPLRPAPDKKFVSGKVPGPRVISAQALEGGSGCAASQEFARACPHAPAPSYRLLPVRHSILLESGGGKHRRKPRLPAEIPKESYRDKKCAADWCQGCGAHRGSAARLVPYTAAYKSATPSLLKGVLWMKSAPPLGARAASPRATARQQGIAP